MSSNANDDRLARRATRTRQERARRERCLRDGVLCAIPGCVRPPEARGYCSLHYERWRVHGDPLTVLRIMLTGKTPEERFWSRVLKTESCWLWQGKRHTNGYGRFYPLPASQESVLAHRFAYEHLVGPIPPGLVIDHVLARGCTNRHCVNPAHLEVVTQAENNRRTPGSHAPPRTTHCKRGHERTPENTRVYQQPGRNYTHRICRACERLRLAQQRKAR